MLSVAAIMLGAAALDEAKGYLRVVGGDEDALLARLLGSAAALGERFTGQAWIAREHVGVLAASPAWARLGAGPVRAVTGVAALPAAGEAVALAAAEYAVDIDASGDGWVRILSGHTGCVRVTFAAGLAAEWAELPEPLRQGAVRLAAHFYTHRDDAEGAGPPAAVTALWRPFRRMRLI